MKMIIQKVLSAKVIFEDNSFNSIDDGLLVYLGVHKDDTEKDIDLCIKKLLGLRIFEYNEKNFEKSIIDKNFKLLVISNFTLYGDISRGRRPSFTNSANAELGKEMYDNFMNKLYNSGINCYGGIFQTHMLVESVNDGPINIVFNTKEGEWYV